MRLEGRRRRTEGADEIAGGHANPGLGHRAQTDDAQDGQCPRLLPGVDVRGDGVERQQHGEPGASKAVHGVRQEHILEGEVEPGADHRYCLIYGSVHLMMDYLSWQNPQSASPVRPVQSSYNSLLIIIMTIIAMRLHRNLSLRDRVLRKIS